MRKSIFDLEIRIDIKREFANIKEILMEENAIFYNRNFYSLYEVINNDIFPIWKYKGIFVDFDDFCDRLGIDWDYNRCSEENFLLMVELLINLWKYIELNMDSESKKYNSKRVVGYMRINLPLIIEKMNYQIKEERDKLRLIKRDSDVDSVLEIVPQSCAVLLLDYNDIRNNKMQSKKSILKELDLFIEKNKKTYQSIDKNTYNSIQLIVNKMGINHPIEEEPYKSFDDEKLIEWYDKCFKLMLHLIRTKEINEINKERKSFISD